MHKERMLDCIVLARREKIPGKGEDSACFDCVSKQNNKSVMCSVFDGCGGLGAKKYPLFDNHSGAYVGSRAVSGVVFDWYKELCDINKSDEWDIQLKNLIKKALSWYKTGDTSKSKIKGSMTKDFPTTMVTAIVTENNQTEDVCFMWAGDSRGYILNDTGMMQITEDDTNVKDAMANLKEDGVQTNVISAGYAFDIHKKNMRITNPAIVICATDGCYGYLESPIHFEYMLLKCMEMAESFDGWKSNIESYLSRVAGDDFTITLAVYGYGDYENMKSMYMNRRLYLDSEYIKIWEKIGEEDRLICWHNYCKEQRRI